MTTPCFFGTRPDEMYAATFEITNTCNLSCQHCMNKSGSDNHSGLPIMAVLTLAEEMYAAGVRSLYISGGEPLTYPGIDQVLYFCSEKGYKLSLATNGSLVQEHIDTITNCVRDVSISLDGLGSIHDEFRGSSGMFDLFVSTVNSLKGKVNLIVSTVIWNKNIDIIEELVKFVYGLGVGQINFSYLVPLGRAKNPNIHINKEDYFKVQERIKRLQSLYSSKGLTILFRRSTRIRCDSADCEGGQQILHVTSTGIVAPCSWCAKLNDGIKEMTYQWKPGNFVQCLNHIQQLKSINDKRKLLYGYTGGPAMSKIYNGSIMADDPLNQLL